MLVASTQLLYGFLFIKFFNLSSICFSKFFEIGISVSIKFSSSIFPLTICLFDIFMRAGCFLPSFDRAFIMVITKSTIDFNRTVDEVANAIYAIISGPLS